MKLALIALVILVVWVWLVSHLTPSNSDARTRGEGVRASAQPVAVPLTRLPVATGTGGRTGIPQPSAPVASHASRHRNGGEFILETTAYTWTGNRTASGIWPRKGIAASDLFPLGTLLDIEGVGRVVVEDRVGCCTQLDIYLPTERECIEFGRRRLHVEVVR
jgi:3D (Asp-Asp-Asp) domain-containing protein